MPMLYNTRYSSKRRVTVMIAIVWVLSFTISCPLLFGLNNTGKSCRCLLSAQLASVQGPGERSLSADMLESHWGPDCHPGLQPGGLVGQAQLHVVPGWAREEQ